MRGLGLAIIQEHETFIMLAKIFLRIIEGKCLMTLERLAHKVLVDTPVAQ